MPILRLIRHAEPSATWGAHPDPGLSVLGHQQARQAALALAGLDHAALITSPLARCRETVAPTEAQWGRQARVEPRVAEIPVPAHVTDHRAWLTGVMTGHWHDVHVGDDLRGWRQSIAETLLGLTEDTLIFSHFVAINAAVGVAQGADKVTVFSPGHASITILESDGRQLRVVELGNEAAIQLT